tara:strand:+ start:192 stop:1073 length:882 start_codon:yes stop_codon:yes gene_type:complete
MTSRQEILEEKLLRENIRRAISIVKDKKQQKENYIRTIVRHLINEVEIKYDYISLKRLADFIEQQVGNPANMDGKPSFKEGYIQFASSKENRERYLEYILDLANEDFKTMDANLEPQSLSGDFIEKGFSAEKDPEDDAEEDEVITVSIRDLEDAGGDVNPNIEEPEESEEDEEEFQLGESEIDPEENSGIKRISREIYKKMAPALRDQYQPLTELGIINKPVEISGKQYEAGELSETDLFKIYFKKNLILWAERYEDEYFDSAPDEDVNIDSERETPEEITSDESEEEEIFKL